MNMQFALKRISKSLNINHEESVANMWQVHFSPLVSLS